MLLLVRHGQASLGSADYDRLSELGHVQAQAVGVRLRRADLAAARIVSGGLVRQRDTARSVLAELGALDADPQVDTRLDEYDHVGVLSTQRSGQTFQAATTEDSRRALQSALDEALARWVAAGEDEGYPESHPGFLDRVGGVLHELADAPGVTVAVTSAGVIAAAAASALGLPDASWPTLARLVVNASVTKLISGRTGTSLLTFNDHAHLEHDRALVTYR